METKEKSFKKNEGFGEEEYEFVLYINGNIICQRGFNIFNFNEDSLNKETMDSMLSEICGMGVNKFNINGLIPKHLKKKSIDYLWENYNPYSEQSEEASKVSTRKGDLFRFEFKVGKKVVAQEYFDNDFFTLSSTVSVDIREIIPAIIAEIRQTTSKKSY